MPKVKSPTPRLPKSKAAERERQARAEQCLAEVLAVARKHRCRLRATIILADGQAHGRVEVIALEQSEVGAN